MSVSGGLMSHAYLLSSDWSVLGHPPAQPCDDSGPARKTVLCGCGEWVGLGMTHVLYRTNCVWQCHSTCNGPFSN